MDLTTLARVKAATGNTSNANDALLAQLVTSVSRDLERQMCRHAERKARVEVLAVRANERWCSLAGFPVDLTQPFSVVACPSRNFTSGDAVAYARDVDYTVDETSGAITLLSLPATFTTGAQALPIAPAYLQVTYTGGLAADTAGLVADYPDLADACDLQVAHRFKSKDAPGARVVKLGGAESQKEGEYKLLDRVVQVCTYYRRTVFA
jgi:hypothetical protein